MARELSSWMSGPGTEHPGGRGQRLDLPERGPGSPAGMGRRLAALLIDWLLAYGLAGLGLTFGLLTPAGLATAVLVIWLVLGVIELRLFGFTPGQLACGLQVVSVDQRGVGLGRALARGMIVALVIPALFTDADGRGIQDQWTRTVVVRR